jgi:hypothetical protein
MCEVEFWEVFFSVKTKGFLCGYLRPHVDCRIANFELYCFLLSFPAGLLMNN